MLDPAPASPWRVTATRAVYRNPWTELREDELAGPDGRRGMYGYFAGRDAVLVMPVFPDRSVLLVRQWRHVYGCSSWEAVCGAVEDGETIADAARRELAEEAGLSARRWTPLGRYHCSDARVAGATACFLAEDLDAAAAERDASECDLVVERLPLADAVAAALDGRITHVGTLWLLLRAERSLPQRPPA